MDTRVRASSGILSYDLVESYANRNIQVLSYVRYQSADMKFLYANQYSQTTNLHFSSHRQNGLAVLL